jgi:hypothetical protein
MRPLTLIGALAVLVGTACARNTARDPYGTARDSTMTVKVDSTKTDTVTKAGDTTATAR